jgi:hypothetical protein
MRRDCVGFPHPLRNTQVASASLEPSQTNLFCRPRLVITEGPGADQIGGAGRLVVSLPF